MRGPIALVADSCESRLPSLLPNVEEHLLESYKLVQVGDLGERVGVHIGVFAVMHVRVAVHYQVACEVLPAQRMRDLTTLVPGGGRSTSVKVLFLLLCRLLVCCCCCIVDVFFYAFAVVRVIVDVYVSLFASF